MEKRPVSLTIIGSWMVITVLMTIYSIAITASNPIAMQMREQMHVSLLFQQATGTLAILINAACAYGVFKGQPWSRVLYVCWSIVGAVVAFYTTPIRSIILFSLIFFAVVTYFLFRPVANRWFAAKGLQLQRQEA